MVGFLADQSAVLVQEGDGVVDVFFLVLRGVGGRTFALFFQVLIPAGKDILAGQGIFVGSGGIVRSGHGLVIAVFTAGQHGAVVILEFHSYGGVAAVGQNTGVALGAVEAILVRKDHFFHLIVPGDLITCQTGSRDAFNGILLGSSAGIEHGFYTGRAKGGIADGFDGVGKDDALQAGAAGEVSFSDGTDGGQNDFSKAGAILECVTADGFHGAGNVDGLQAGAIAESGFINGGNAVRDDDTFQIGTAGEGVCADFGDTVGNLNAFQAGAVHEGLRINSGDGVGDVHGFQTGAFEEQNRGDVSHGRGKGDTFQTAAIGENRVIQNSLAGDHDAAQTGAALEGIVADKGDAVRNVDALQGGTAGECKGLDGGHRLAANGGRNLQLGGGTGITGDCHAGIAHGVIQPLGKQFVTAAGAYPVHIVVTWGCLGDLMLGFVTTGTGTVGIAVGGTGHILGVGSPMAIGVGVTVVNIVCLGCIRTQLGPVGLGAAVVNIGQLVIPEGLFLNGGNGSGNHHGGQIGAQGEGLVSDGGSAPGDGDSFQIIALLEGIVIDGGDTAGDGKTHDGRTAQGPLGDGAGPAELDGIVTACRAGRS